MIDLPTTNGVLDSAKWYTSSLNTDGIIQAATILLNTLLNEYYFNPRVGVMSINTNREKRVFDRNNLNDLLTRTFAASSLFKLESFEYTFVPETYTLHLDVTFTVKETGEAFVIQTVSGEPTHVNKQPGFKFFINRLGSYRLSS